MGDGTCSVLDEVQWDGEVAVIGQGREGRRSARVGWATTAEDERNVKTCLRWASLEERSGLVSDRTAEAQGVTNELLRGGGVIVLVNVRKYGREREEEVMEDELRVG